MLANEPTPFLSTIQVGITLVRIFAGAFGGATIAKGLAAYLGKFPALAPYSDALSINFVVLVIYLTLIFGELVPGLHSIMRNQLPLTLQNLCYIYLSLQSRL